MMISYTSGYYVYLASSYVQARHKKLKSGINLQNPVHNCKRSTCRECITMYVPIMYAENYANITEACLVKIL